ncbi:DUF4232 domain-containing protein [Streptomyces rubellomurinus]|uniref:DUF4232 domain-containing protein n=1 Tax=Streptomyces rubellomurinus (strain ATCC 31215) TaxID=359131 RepID=A0A0F2TLC4_STRR3|nr:DUF4232 domain-containing protein [Streptomyces rubellomurinus]KJS63080.1 hypothetical protein VM95_05025 [Streptomyces rubellomurinus]
MRQFAEPSRPLAPAASATAVATAVAAAAALLAGCGSTGASTPGTRNRAECAAKPSELTQGGVRVTVDPVCGDYQVTNQGGEPADVTVTFNRPALIGGGLEPVPRTETALAPGATARGRIDPADPRASPRPGTAHQVKIVRVRSVPTTEAPQPGGPCPPSGVRLYADEGDAAMGLRVVGLNLRNCGTSPVSLDGYPTLQLLDHEHLPIDGVRLLSGGAEIATGTGADAPPQKLTLRPGEGAHSTLVWRNTTEAGAAVNAPYVRVRATPNAAPVTVTPELDLGTTGRLGIGAWVKDQT